MRTTRQVLPKGKAGVSSKYHVPKKPVRNKFHRQRDFLETGTGLILQNVTDIFYIIYPAGRDYRYLSPAFETITGYRPQEKDGFPSGLFDLVLMEDRPALLHAWEDTPRNPAFDIQYRIRCADGRVLYMRDKGTVVSGQPGEKPLLVGAVRDRTNQRNLQEALLASEIQLQQVADHMDEVFWVRSRQTGRFVYASPAFEKVWGIDWKNLVNMEPILDRIHRDDLALVQSALLAQEKGEKTSVEYRVLLPDGKFHWLWGRSFPIYSEDTSNGNAGKLIQTGGITTDISSVKLLQEQLRNTNKILDDQVNHQLAEIVDIYEHSPIGYHSLDVNGIFIMVNQTELDWLGYRSEELVGVMHVTQLLTAESLELFKSHFPGFKKSGFLKDLELDFIRKDGSILPLLVNATAQYDADGNYVMSRTALLDRTELKRAEVLLKEQERTFRALFENSSDCIILVSPQGYKLDANPFTLSLLGYTREEFLQLPYEKLVPIEQQNDAADKYLRVAKGEKVALIERTWLTKTGERLEMEINLSPVFNESGELIMVQNVARNVTERKNAQDLIVSQRDFARQVMDAMGQGLLVSDAEGRVEYLNPALKKMLGMDPENGVNGEYERFTSVEYQEGVAQHLIKGNIGIPLEFDYQMHTLASGEDRNMRITVTPRWDGENVIGTIAVFTDLSREKEVEKNLLASREQLRQTNIALENAAKMKDEFLSSMSHELRTPLTGILGLSEIMRLGMYGELSEKQLNAVSNIENSGKVLLELVNDILDLTRMESGSMQLEPELCSIDEVCRAAIKLVSGLVRQKNQNVSYSGPEDNILVMADVRRLKQVLVNLLRNAVKFTPDFGSLGLLVKTDETAKQLTLCVWDTGIGIKEEDKSRLFVPFLQLDGRLERKYSGVGLGLALVNRLVELHGGWIRVESEPGLGSRFTITLPMGDIPEEKRKNFHHIPFVENKGVTWKERVGDVLVVSGRQAGSGQLVHALSNLGITSQVCSLADDVPGMAALSKPGIILMLVEKPYRPLLDVLGTLKADLRTMSIPVLVICPVRAVDADSQDGLDVLYKQAVSQGAAGVLTEPVSLIQFRKELDNLVKHAGQV